MTRTPETNAASVSRRDLLAATPAAALTVILPGAVASAAAAPAPAVPTRLELLHYAGFLWAEYQAVCEQLGLDANYKTEMHVTGAFNAHKAMMAKAPPSERALPVLQAVEAPILQGNLHLWREVERFPELTNIVEAHRLEREA